MTSSAELQIQTGSLQEHPTLVLLVEFARQAHEASVALGRMLKPALASIAAAFERLKSEDPVPGYESFFAAQGLKDNKVQRIPDPENLSAKFLARAVKRLGQQLLAELNTDRALASAVGQLKKRDKRSRGFREQAERVVQLLAQNHGSGALGDALASLSTPKEVWDFEALSGKAAAGDSEASEALQALCADLSLKLRSPRGRPYTLQGVTHELLLAMTDLTCVWDAYAGQCVDAATIATRKAFGATNFCPKAAVRRVRKWAELRPTFKSMA